MVELDHTKKYMVIDGHPVTVSFSRVTNNDLFGRIKSILLSSDTLPQICEKPPDSATIQQTKEGA